MTDEEDRDAEEEDCAEPEPDKGEPEGFTSWDELQETFGDGEPIKRMFDGSAPHLPEGGLPTPLPDDSLAAIAPPLTEETMVCLPDLRSFVLRDRWGAKLLELSPDEVERAPNGLWRARAALVGERLRDRIGALRASQPLLPDKPVPMSALLAFLATRVASRYHRGPDPVDDDEWVTVEPVRPVCQHFVEQLEPPGPGETHLQYGWMQRYCAVRRSVSGAFKRLTDEGMRSCSVRQPLDPESGKLIDEMNAVKIGQGRKREYYDMFNLVSRELGIAKPETAKPEGTEP